jgi:actin-related protein
MIKKVALLLLLIIAIPIINSEIYGHTFTTDESVLFLTLVDKLKTHAKLTEQFILGNNHESAIQHSNLLKQLYTKEINDEIEEKNERIANEISSFINTFSSLSSNNMTQSQINNTIQDFEAVLDESISVRISEDVLNNSTIQALRIATLVNDIDINYADSFSTQPYNMSTMGMDQHDEQSMNMSTMDMDQHDQNSSVNESKDIQNYTAYQTAQELLVPVSQLFEEIRSEKEISNQDKVTQLKEGIDNLTTIIEMKKPYNEVAKVIHGIIQPTLQELYNLKIDIE